MEVLEAVEGPQLVRIPSRALEVLAAAAEAGLFFGAVAELERVLRQQIKEEMEPLLEGLSSSIPVA
jgi:hypothetical protein